MGYTYEYPRPAVTVDIIILKKTEQGTHILLIQRKNPPFQGKWALPGGFVDVDESLKHAAHRELQEETNLRHINLTQFQAFGEVDRDPRGRTISVVYYGYLNSSQNDKAGSDASKTKWFNLNRLPELAFDHQHILSLFRNHLNQNSENPG
jgi:8-oxo-dGTP diphosphatase